MAYSTDVDNMHNAPALVNRPRAALTYTKAGAFLAPAVAVWWLSAVFVFPRLQQLWTETGFSEPVFTGFLRGSNIVLGQGVWILAVAILLFVLLERHGGAWLRFRSLVLGIGVWVLNAAVLVLLGAMLLSALIAAPGLIRWE